MQHVRAISNDRHMFAGTIRCQSSGRQGYAIRIVPGLPDQGHPLRARPYRMELISVFYIHLVLLAACGLATTTPTTSTPTTSTPTTSTPRLPAIDFQTGVNPTNNPARRHHPRGHAKQPAGPLPRHRRRDTPDRQRRQKNRPRLLRRLRKDRQRHDAADDRTQSSNHFHLQRRPRCRVRLAASRRCRPAPDLASPPMAFRRRRHIR